MRKLTQPRRLRRSFGSQLVGNVAGSRCPEAGLEARVVLANRRVRLFTKDNGRLGDLATWRLGDLVVDDNRGAGSRTMFRSRLRCFHHLQHQRRRFRLKPRFRNPTSLPKPQELSKRLLPCLCSASFITRKAPFTNSSEEPKVAPGWVRILGINYKY
jgi:hypothetical protein